MVSTDATWPQLYRRIGKRAVAAFLTRPPAPTGRPASMRGTGREGRGRFRRRNGGLRDAAIDRKAWRRGDEQDRHLALEGRLDPVASIRLGAIERGIGGR